MLRLGDLQVVFINYNPNPWWLPLCVFLNYSVHGHMSNPEQFPGDPQDHQAAVVRVPYTFAHS